MIEDERLGYLFRRFTEGVSTPQELEAFWALVRNERQAGNLDEALTQLWAQEDITPAVYAGKEAMLEKIHERIHSLEIEITEDDKLRRLPRKRWMVAAAAVLFILLGSGLFYLLENKKTNVEQVAVQFKNDVPPGHNGAILQLADGSQIVLDSAANGNIATQAGTKVIKNGAELTYQKTAGKTVAVSYNTIITPRARQFSVKLPDGTQVWLNASSSLKYPTAFTGKERVVELTGEGYFEVAKNPDQPFHVKTTGGVDVRVLGTHFNINAYADESYVRTTLAEGSVRVTVTGNNRKVETQTIVPGQQAALDTRSGNLAVRQVDVDAILAWKDGYIALDGTHIHELMRQIARWYDVDVTYQGSFSGDDFAGRIPRNESLVKVLEILEKTGVVHFSVNGKNVLVTP